MRKRVLGLAMAFGVTGVFINTKAKPEDPGDWNLQPPLNKQDLILSMTRLEELPESIKPKPKWFQGSESTKFKAKNANNNYNTRKFKRNNRHK